MYLKLYTVPLLVSGQTYKISKGSNNYCSQCTIKYDKNNMIKIMRRGKKEAQKPDMFPPTHCNLNTRKAISYSNFIQITCGPIAYCLSATCFIVTACKLSSWKFSSSVNDIQAKIIQAWVNRKKKSKAFIFVRSHSGSLCHCTMWTKNEFKWLKMGSWHLTFKVMFNRKCLFQINSGTCFNYHKIWKRSILTKYVN